MRATRFLLALLGVVSFGASAHGGGLNAEGCHNERRTGGYHCHGAARIVQAAPPVQRPMNSAPVSPGVVPQRAAQMAPARVSGPVCHVGPRGGTYTITASGRKNYSGC